MSIKVKRYRAQPIGKLMSSRDNTALLFRQTVLIERVQSCLRDHLPDDIAAHIFVGGFKEGHLTIISDKAGWLTWLRYEQQQLLALIHQVAGFERVTQLKFKVRPVHVLEVPIRPPRHLSPVAADVLEACAADTEDKRLKEALKRLASHGKQEASSH